MGRLIVSLSVATGIAPSVWAAEDPAAIRTAVDLIDEQRKSQRRGR